MIVLVWGLEIVTAIAILLALECWLLVRLGPRLVARRPPKSDRDKAVYEARRRTVVRLYGFFKRLSVIGGVACVVVGLLVWIRS